MPGSNAALITFGIYLFAVFMLAVLSNRISKGKEFVGEYFLGSRSFGVWAFALTFAATNASGGSFIGFPAQIYSHGWTLALWIAGFMALPLVAMGLLGKRMNQVARKARAVTIPDILRERFRSPAVGIVATTLLLFFMFFYLMAQFKAGGNILVSLLQDQPAFQVAIESVASFKSGIPWLAEADAGYLACLGVFSVAVIVYVVYGGFRAVVWTDVMQGIVMFAGVLLMLGLVLYHFGGLGNATRKIAEMTPPRMGQAVIQIDQTLDEPYVIPKGSWWKQDGEAYRLAEDALISSGETKTEEAVSILQVTTPFEKEKIESSKLEVPIRLVDIETNQFKYGDGKKGVYVSNPGPSQGNSLGFLALGTAVSFFIFWPFAATGQPGNMVRLMSFRDTRTLRYSIVTVSIYYSVIYFSLVVIFCCARLMLPGMEIAPDRVMPEMAKMLTYAAGVPWLAGLLVAAPFAAVMSSVDSFLLLLSSGVVRDIYQRNLNPEATEARMKWMSYGVTMLIGLMVALAVVNPIKYLQDWVVFASGGLAACFLIPIVLTLYWRRMTGPAIIASMIGGTLIHLGLTMWGYQVNGEFRPYALFGLEPFIWDLAGSAIAAVAVALLGKEPESDLVREYFEA